MKKLIRFLTWSLVTTLTLISLGFIALMWSIDEPKKREITQMESDIAVARRACQTLIEGQLHDPGSAEWGRVALWPAGVDSENPEQIIVQPEIRARNAFGAMVLSRFQCTFRGSGEAMILIDISEY